MPARDPRRWDDGTATPHVLDGFLTRERLHPSPKVPLGMFGVPLIGGRWLAIEMFKLKDSPHLRMLTALATTSRATTSEIASSAIIISFIQGLMAETSVGLKAVAVAKAKWK